MNQVQAKMRPVTRTSLSEKIASQIMDLISSSALKPGERLPAERELCQQFGVGRSSLREALRCLSIVGVLDVRVGDGTFVARDGQKFVERVFQWRVLTERKDVENLLEVRLAIESETASAAAVRGTTEQHEAIGSLLEEMKGAMDDVKRFVDLDVQFHLAIASASSNQLMHDLLTMIRGQLHQTLEKVNSIPGGKKLGYRQHREIFKAIQARDPETAKSLMREHILAALSRYREYLV